MFSRCLANLSGYRIQVGVYSTRKLGVGVEYSKVVAYLWEMANN
jgi:hypothetical protein